jgi:hypothetical protein
MFEANMRSMIEAIASAEDFGLRLRNPGFARLMNLNAWRITTVMAEDAMSDHDRS